MLPRTMPHPESQHWLRRNPLARPDQDKPAPQSRSRRSPCRDRPAPCPGADPAARCRHHESSADPYRIQKDQTRTYPAGSIRIIELFRPTGYRLLQRQVGLARATSQAILLSERTLLFRREGSQHTQLLGRGGLRPGGCRHQRCRAGRRTVTSATKTRSNLQSRVANAAASRCSSPGEPAGSLQNMRECW